MQSAFSFVRKNLAYTFVVFGAIWVVIAFLAGSALVLWPAVACVVAGILLRAMPGSRLAIAWGPAAAILGLLLCAYQVYAAIPLLTGAFVMVASVSVVVFFLLGLGHAYLAFASYTTSQAK
jgi:hypothetical protein